MTARGTFDVKVIPQAADDGAGGPFSRLFLDKQFHGDLEATSKGQMLAAGTAVEGSAGYVALELVSGTLNGRRGSFILQHKARVGRAGGNGTVTDLVIGRLAIAFVAPSSNHAVSAAADALTVSK